VGIQNWSENTIIVDLTREPEMRDELDAVMEMSRDKSDCDVVMDFTDVDIVTSSSLSKLLKLRKIVSDSGHKLVLCNVSAATKGIFMVTGLDSNFEFADDKSKVLASL